MEEVYQTESSVPKSAVSINIVSNHEKISDCYCTDLNGEALKSACGKSVETKIAIDDDVKTDGKANLGRDEEANDAVGGNENQMVQLKETTTQFLRDADVPNNNCLSSGLSPEGEDPLKKQKPPDMHIHPFDAMKYAWEHSKGRMDFFLRAVAITLTSCCWFFCIGGIPLLPIALIIVGCIFLEDCSAGTIPLFLMIIGAVNILGHLTGIWLRCLGNDEKKFVFQRPIAVLVDRLLVLTLCIIIVRASIFVYAEFEPDYVNKRAWNYCNKTFYLFSFWMCNLFYGFCGIFLVFAMYLSCCSSSSTKKKVQHFFIAGKAF